jgi:hypothetical protein
MVSAILSQGLCQETINPEGRILFHGLVMDGSSLMPVSNSQIMINNEFSSVSGNDGSFAFYVNRKDTVLFRRLGYKATIMFISDSLKSIEFIAGIYMNSDTLSIGEVVIVPRFTNLKSEIMNSRSKTPSTFDNARYNVAVSGYQGRNTQGSLGTPSDNYAALSQKQKVAAFERGGIPSDQMVGISSLLLIPAAYMLLKGSPEKPPPFKTTLSTQEVEELNKRYLELINQRK